MSTVSIPPRPERRQYSASAKLDEETKRLLTRTAAERGVTQSQIVLEALAGKPVAEAPIAGAARAIVVICHDLRRHLKRQNVVDTSSDIAACCEKLVASLPSLFELVRQEVQR
jgi:uncharacterized protein (DUF1778 family)